MLALNLDALLGLKRAGVTLTGPVVWLQILAAVVYTLAFIASLVVWIKFGLTDRMTTLVAIVQEVARSGLGLALAALGALLGVNFTVTIITKSSVRSADTELSSAQ
jgi:hypothetical protein